MSGFERADRASAGDVLVIGAGIAGTLTARQLQDAGLDVTLIDTRGFGARQSNHSHGYIHAGHIYRHGERALVEALASANERWRVLGSDLGVAPIHRRSHVAFTNELNARAAASAWHRLGLPVRRLPAEALPAGIRAGELAAVYQTEEPCYDLTEVFRALSARLARVRTVTAKAVALLGEGQIEGVLARIAGRQVALTARFYVIAAGDRNARLAEGVTHFRGRAIVRTSYMVVIRGDSLPALSVVMPENETHGLFIVSRPAPDGRNVWLVSNFLSYADGPTAGPAPRLWLRGLTDRLARLTTVARSPDNQWGLYAAPKAELRARPGELGAHAQESYGLPNALVLAPTKLTLAPLLADEAAAAVQAALARIPAAARTAEYLRRGHLEVMPERWTRSRLLPRDTFFKQSAAALNVLRRGARGTAPSAWAA